LARPERLQPTHVDCRRCPPTLVAFLPEPRTRARRSRRTSPAGCHPSYTLSRRARRRLWMCVSNYRIAGLLRWLGRHPGVRVRRVPAAARCGVRRRCSATASRRGLCARPPGAPDQPVEHRRQLGSRSVQICDVVQSVQPGIRISDGPVGTSARSGRRRRGPRRASSRSLVRRRLQKARFVSAAAQRRPLPEHATLLVCVAESVYTSTISARTDPRRYGSQSITRPHRRLAPTCRFHLIQGMGRGPASTPEGSPATTCRPHRRNTRDHFGFISDAAHLLGFRPFRIADAG